MEYNLSPKSLESLKAALPKLILYAAQRADYAQLESYVKSFFSLERGQFSNVYTQFTLQLRSMIEAAYDLKVVEIIVSYADNLTMSELQSLFVDILNDYVAISQGKLIAHDTMQDFIVKAVKICIEYKKEFSLADIHNIHAVLPSEDFVSFIKMKNIDLNNPLYKEFSFEDYSVFNPLLTLEQGAQSFTMTELLLSRTNATGIPTEEVVSFYDQLSAYKDVSVRAVMQLTAASIADKSSDLKIFFRPNVPSEYDQALNHVVIDTNTHHDFITLKPVIIHELGHYLFNHLYKSNLLPYNFKILEGENIFNPENFIDASTTFYNKWSSLLGARIEYVNAGKDFVNLAANILGCPSFDYFKEELRISYDALYIDEPLVYYSKFICPEINLISHELGIEESIDKLPQDQTSEDHAQEDFDHTISAYNFYRKMENFNSTANPISRDVNLETAAHAVEKELLPYFLDSLSLTSSKLYVVKRVNDWINRGEGLIRDLPWIGNQREDLIRDLPWIGKPDSRDVELFVRLPEFITCGVGRDEMAQLDNMQKFWIDFVIPDVNAYMADFGAKCSDPTNDIPCIVGLNATSTESL